LRSRKREVGESAKGSYPQMSQMDADENDPLSSASICGICGSFSLV
jgi:hypothetical protein